MLHGYFLFPCCTVRVGIPSLVTHDKYSEIICCLFSHKISFCIPCTTSNSGELGSLWLKQWCSLGWSNINNYLWIWALLCSGTIQRFGLKMELEGRFAICAWAPMPFWKLNSEILRTVKAFPVELISYDRDQQGLSLHLVASRQMEMNNIKTKSVV